MTQEPAWYRDAIATPFVEGVVEVAGCPIHYQHWSNPGAPALLLVHGYAAHSHWWDFIAPLLLDQYQVVALDISGCGESGHRDHYDLATYAAELMAVAEATRLPEPFTLIGHSFGGGIVLKAATLYPERLRGIVLVDSSVVRPPGEASQRRTIGALPTIVHPDLPTAIERFRLIPPQHCPNQFLVDYIARHSYRQSSEGWQLKSDAKLLGRFEREDQTDALLALRCRFGVIHGGLSSTFRAEQRDYLAYVAPPGSPFVELPGANHHLFIDQPLEFAAQLKTLLAQW
ncbi:MAG: alpha/beta hydrolase [Pseudomonadales bacterium]|jgi:pimeloyl-ACP methyl ester carboxylesterase|nr:alpha/beta hydrolase [Pseudomonadales bacterium]HMU90182.1 alpha/beta hydrolase [Pseudomonadales bacterium]HMZ70086.1 alpha/beta hydrolase [Pseudomonadales bacterium]HMZ91159.1 alpha/beta hydrolase [Pseudomonadales bacterium]HNB83427.1 alpha/beta hydrolase [Pseudomonadales bacterium]